MTLEPESMCVVPLGDFMRCRLEEAEEFISK